MLYFNTNHKDKDIKTLYLIFGGFSGVMVATLTLYMMPFLNLTIIDPYNMIFAFTFFTKYSKSNNKRWFSTNNNKSNIFKLQLFLIKVKNIYLWVKSYFNGPNVFLACSFIFSVIGLVLNYITTLQCGIILSTVIFIYALTFTSYYEKMVKFTEEADSSFEEYLKTKHWIWRTKPVLGSIIRVLFFVYVISASLNKLTFLPFIGLCLSFILFLYCLLSIGLLYFAIKKKNPWSTAKQIYECAKIGCSIVGGAVTSDFFFEKSRWGWNHRPLASNTVSAVFDGIVSSKEFDYNLYNEYIRNDPNIDQSRFYEKQYGLKVLNGKAIKEHIFTGGQGDTLQALEHWSKTGEVLIKRDK